MKTGCSLSMDLVHSVIPRNIVVRITVDPVKTLYHFFILATPFKIQCQYCVYKRREAAGHV